MDYKESLSAGDPFRKEYLSGIKKILEKRQCELKYKRMEYGKNILKNREKCRQDLVAALGWPLTQYKISDNVESRKVFLYAEKGISVYRMQIEVMDDLWFYGLLFVKDDCKKFPFIIFQHGFMGSPELAAGMYDFGSLNYNDVVSRIIKYGANVFVPQSLTWKLERHYIEYDRDLFNRKMIQMGGSLKSLEIYAIRKSIDYFSLNGLIKDNTIGMIGLSHGAFYTLLTSAVDVRVKTCIANCFYYNIEKYHNKKLDLEIWEGAKKFCTPELAMLISPRKLYLQYGDKDEAFKAEEGKKEYDTIIEYCGTDQPCSWIDFEIFHGNHEFNSDDKVIKKLILDLN